jgi:hypothetical protein
MSESCVRTSRRVAAEGPEPLPRSPLWQSRYDRFVSSMIERTSVKKFVIIEKRKVDKFPSAPVSLLLADVGEITEEEHDWNPVNYDEEVQPYAIGRSSLKRFPVLAFESSDADFIAENLNSVMGCRLVAPLNISSNVECEAEAHPYFALMLAATITLPHLLVSSEISLPKSAGDPESNHPPASAPPSPPLPFRAVSSLNRLRAEVLATLPLGSMPVR